MEIEIVFTDLVPPIEHKRRLVSYSCISQINETLRDIKKITISDLSNDRISATINNLEKLNKLTSIALIELKKIKGEIK